ncbi:hypothetical protein [Kribbella sp. NPDC004875]|uniref:nucleotidyltransferase domain-containing protein n=1 Tax=Kribbella sp. NPDC004875 TaxID=3364107 RepID=UPI0036931C74
MNTPPPAPQLAAIRNRWLSAATTALRSDPLVLGAALIGSLGGGRADDWSDVDLLIVVDDAHLDSDTTAEHLPPGDRTFSIDARHNGPLGTRALSAQYVVDGLPLWVDWHVHPLSLAAWLPDSTVLLDHRGIPKASTTDSRREPSTPKSPEEEAALRLALIPIAGKQVARRSPHAAATIHFLGGPHLPDPHAQLRALRELLTQFPNPPTATATYLDLVEQSLH